MRLLVQRSLNSSVTVDNKIVGKIDSGLVVFVGFKTDDSINDIEYLVKKLVNLRIFDDLDGVMNKSILDVGGKVLSISQFTLYADTKKGNRPSYVNSMKQEDASKMYDIFNEKLKQYVDVETGIFRSDMKVCITNNGPVTIMLESRG
ncbi:MAG: D-tyrosyl-tRNA(Tyr) deacylase [Bacilli bacterium]|nr:D-tyrosyl-tRNA(Tyr) deacylase [Bacilli bacterium]